MTVIISPNYAHSASNIDMKFSQLACDYQSVSFMKFPDFLVNFQIQLLFFDFSGQFSNSLTYLKNVTKPDIYQGKKIAGFQPNKCKQGKVLIWKGACRTDFLPKKNTRASQPTKTPQSAGVQNMLNHKNEVPGKFCSFREIFELKIPPPFFFFFSRKLINREK